MSELGVDSKNIGGYTKRLKVLQSDLIKLPPDKLNFAEKNLGPMINTLPKEELSLSMEVAEINENAVSNYRQLAEAKVKTETLTEEVKQDDLTIKKAQNIPAVQQAQADLASAKAKKKAVDLAELANKGKNALDWITNNLGKPIKKGVVGALGIELARQFIDKPLETGTSIASELLLERGIGTGPAFGVTTALQSSRLNPDQVSSGEYTTLTSDQENLLRNMQNVAQSDTNIQTDEAPRPQALNIIEQDTNIGNKMGTFGRTPDVSPGFVTPPSKSDLADETQRQQNFMGVN